MSGHGLIDLDKFNYVSNISFLKIQNESTTIPSAISLDPIFSVKARRWPEGKRSSASIVLKREREPSAWRWSSFPATLKKLWHQEGPHCAFCGLLMETTLPDSGQKHMWVHAAAWERHAVRPISAHLEQWRSPESALHPPTPPHTHTLRIGASNRRHPLHPTWGGAWGFTK